MVNHCARVLKPYILVLWAATVVLLNFVFVCVRICRFFVSIIFGSSGSYAVHI